MECNDTPQPANMDQYTEEEFAESDLRDVPKLDALLFPDHAFHPNPNISARLFPALMEILYLGGVYDIETSSWPNAPDFNTCTEDGAQTAHRRWLSASGSA